MRYKSNPRGAVDNCHILCGMRRSDSGDVLGEENSDVEGSVDWSKAKKERKAEKKAIKECARAEESTVDR